MAAGQGRSGWFPAAPGAPDAHRVCGPRAPGATSSAMPGGGQRRTPGGHDDGRRVLLIRRHRYTRKLSFYRCWTPRPVPLARLIAIAVTRWRIEEDHQLAKQSTGLDAGQVIRWKSWHRWTAICLLAYIYLAVTAAIQRQHDATSDLDAGLIPITIPELLRLVRDTVIRSRATAPTACTGRPGDAATTSAHARPVDAGTLTPRPRHDHNELQPPSRWLVSNGVRGVGGNRSCG